MPPERNDFVKGMEFFLNHPTASYAKNPQVFKELQQKSGMSISDMFKHVGRTSKYYKPKEPSDEEKSKARLNHLEASSTQ